MDSGLVLQAPRSRAAAFGCESPPGNPIGGQFGQCRSCRDRPLCGESSKPLDSLDRNIFGFTMLHCAAGHRSAAALEELLVQCRPEKPDLSRALFDAAVVRSGSAELVQRLIGLRADIDFRYSMPRRVGLAKDRREKRINWPVGQRFNVRRGLQNPNEHRHVTDPYTTLQNPARRCFRQDDPPGALCRICYFMVALDKLTCQSKA